LFLGPSSNPYQPNQASTFPYFSILFGAYATVNFALDIRSVVRISSIWVTLNMIFTLAQYRKVCIFN